MMANEALLTRQVRAIVPLKSIKKSKTRLSKLKRDDRAKLTMAMFRNVLLALRNARKISGITVVGHDSSASRLAHRYGARFLWEGRGHGLNRAVRLGIQRLDHQPDGAAMIIHADLPLVKSHDIDKFLAQSHGAQIAIVPCKNGTGTNALLRAPPNAIRPVFGEGSYRRHLALAKQTCLRCKVVRIRGIEFDVDDARDLRRLVQYDGLNGSFSFLKKSTNPS
jgi:2-phospho-L-lactate guanylyltransferase